MKSYNNIDRGLKNIYTSDGKSLFSRPTPHERWPISLHQLAWPWNTRTTLPGDTSPPSGFLEITKRYFTNNRSLQVCVRLSTTIVALSRSFKFMFQYFPMRSFFKKKKGYCIFVKVIFPNALYLSSICSTLIWIVHCFVHVVKVQE